jgi:hypothetical protein
MYIDFPVSIFALGLAWHDGRALLWFGLLGTLWWYLLSYGSRAIFDIFIASGRPK